MLFLIEKSLDVRCVLYTYVLVLGLLTGYFMEKITTALIVKRIQGDFLNLFSGKPRHTLGWMTLNSVCWLGVVFLGGLNFYTVECAAVLSVCMILAAVDISIKKIPNELLLVLLLVHFTGLILRGQYSTISLYLIGLGIGLVLFLVPGLMGKGAGLGDVKFAAVVGFILGIYDFFVAVMVMGVLVLIYAVYLIGTGRGGLKSQLALGPFLALGTAAVLIFNISLNQDLTFL